MGRRRTPDGPFPDLDAVQVTLPPFDAARLVVSVGADFLVMRGYGGHGAKIRLDDGKDYPNCKQLGLLELRAPAALARQ